MGVKQIKVSGPRFAKQANQMAKPKGITADTGNQPQERLALAGSRE